MNEQTSKERVLKVYPDAEIWQRHGIWCILAERHEMLKPPPSMLSGWWRNTPQAWDDAASRLTETTKELPSSPAGEMGKHKLGCSFLGRDPSECCRRKPLGADISGPKGSGGAAPEARGMFICAAFKITEQGPYINLETRERRKYVRRCDLDEGHEGDHVDRVLLVNWPQESAAPIAPAAQDLVAASVLTVLFYSDAGHLAADRDIEASKNGPVIASTTSTLYINQLRLRIQQDPTLADTIKVYWRDASGKQHTVCGLREEDQLRWPVGFLEEDWEIEAKISDLRIAAHAERKEGEAKHG